MDMSWEEHQSWESGWHGDCLVTYWEETKQLEYAGKMGIEAEVILGKYPFYNFQAKRILDIGGGPISMLLKAKDKGDFTIVDPCDYPEWVMKRYTDNGITFLKQKAEDIDVTKTYDLVLDYNVLQHTDDPEKIINNARKISKIIRIFEWIETEITPGHPHSFKKEQLDSWLGGVGQTAIMNGKGCFGPAYFGVFKGKHYA
jgi:hypothetical protein